MFKYENKIFCKVLLIVLSVWYSALFSSYFYHYFDVGLIPLFINYDSVGNRINEWEENCCFILEKYELRFVLPQTLMKHKSSYLWEFQVVLILYQNLCILFLSRKEVVTLSLLWIFNSQKLPEKSNKIWNITAGL